MLGPTDAYPPSMDTWPGTAGYLLRVVEITAPRFVVVEGCVIRDRPDLRAAFDPWWALHSDEPWRIEDVMNHVHLYDVVGDEYEDDDLPVLERAAERIAETWRLALADQHPDRTVVVTVASEPDEYGPTISCAQTPPADPGG